MIGKPSMPVLRGNPLQSKLVVDVPFWEGGGNPKDLVNKKTLTRSNSPTWVTDASGYAINFNGAASSGPYLNLSTANWNFVYNFITVQTIFKVYGPGGNLGGRIYDDGNAGFAVAPLTTSAYRFDWYWSSGAVNALCPANSITTGKLHNVITTYNMTNSANLPLSYIDGILQPTSAYSNTASGSPKSWGATMLIGNRTGADRTLNGRVSLLRIWNRILTQSEIQQLTVNPWCVYN